MTIDVNPVKKYIDIWLERGEEAPDVSAFHAHNKDYQIVIWRSGTGDLAGLTAELLRNNRDLNVSEKAVAPVKPTRTRSRRQERELSR